MNVNLLKMRDRLETQLNAVNLLIGTNGNGHDAAHGHHGFRSRGNITGMKKRHMTAAAKARLSEIARKRWRKAKAAGRTRL